MILAVAFMAFDMFGQQIARIGDVTHDLVDDLVVTDAVGDRTKERTGRLLIVDPTNWSLVRELSGNDGEAYFGRSIAVAQTNEHAFIATTIYSDKVPGRSIRLYQTPTFERVWNDDEHDRNGRLGAFNIDIQCIIEAGAPAVYWLEASKFVESRPTHFKLWRRSFKDAAIVREFDAALSTTNGRKMLLHSGETGTLDGLFLSTYAPITHERGRVDESGKSQIHWFDLATGVVRAVTPEYDEGSAVGISMELPRASHQRFSGDAVAIRRLAKGGEVLMLSKEGVREQLDFIGAEHPLEYEAWGASTCWVNDLDRDGWPDLAVGCPFFLSGAVLIIGSAAGRTIKTVTPPPDGTSGFPEGWTYAPHFGSSVCSIPDQDGDGMDDLAVSATSAGGSTMYPAALSLVSTKSWKIIRVVFERDLVKAKSDK